jgi:hypothetical protein
MALMCDSKIPILFQGSFLQERTKEKNTHTHTFSFKANIVVSSSH